MSVMLDRMVGKPYLNVDGREFTILFYRNWREMTVEFADSGITKKYTQHQILAGKVSDSKDYSIN